MIESVMTHALAALAGVMIGLMFAMWIWRGL